jgi:hypothetical protein
MWTSPNNLILISHKYKLKFFLDWLHYKAKTTWANIDVQVQHVEQDVSDILSLGKEHVLNVETRCPKHLCMTSCPRTADWRFKLIQGACIFQSLLLSANLRIPADYRLDMIGNHN